MDEQKPCPHCGFLSSAEEGTIFAAFVAWRAALIAGAPLSEAINAALEKGPAAERGTEPPKEKPNAE